VVDVKWIKLTTDMFDNRKIKHLRKLPEGNSIVLIWVMLLTMAGRCNAGGMIFLTENIPYTPKMLADELGFEEATIHLALQALENFRMIVTNGSYFSVAGWEEYQNIEGMERIREQNRLRQAKYKARQKALPGNVTDNVTVTEGNATEEDEELEIEIEKEEKVDYKQILGLYHSICKSYPSVRSLSEARKKAIKARLNTYSVEDFKTVFQNAEESDFLKGKNNRNWRADFDWFIADKNFIKVLEGKYADKGRKEIVPGWMAKRELDDDEVAAINAIMGEDLADRAEQLRQRLQG
jgi:predicted phage replisome organizer